MGSQATLTTILDAITTSNDLTVDEYTETLMGHLRNAYYVYVDVFHVYPRDMEELVDGLLYVDIKNYATEMDMKEQQRKAERERDSSRVR